MKFTVAALAALAAISSASPVTPFKRGGIPSLKQLQCVFISDIASLVAKANNGAANTFCSSFIASTTTTTKTSTVTTLTTSTDVVPVTASTTTVTTAATPTVTAYVYTDCGQPGYDLTAAYFFDNSTTDATYAGCSAKCLADTNCVSFAVGSGDCLLYNVPVASNLNPVATSPFLFYDRNCPAGAVPAVPAASVSSSPAPTKRALAARAPIPPPPAFSGVQAARISSACSCIISKPYTSTVVASTTTTVPSTVVVVTSVTVTTNVSTSIITPAPVTVTVTTSAV